MAFVRPREGLKVCQNVARVRPCGVLSASLAPGVEHVAEVVKVAQVGFGGAHGPKILKHVAELFTNSFNIVTLVKAACVVTGGLAS